MFTKIKGAVTSQQAKEIAKGVALSIAVGVVTQLVVGGTSKVVAMVADKIKVTRA